MPVSPHGTSGGSNFALDFLSLLQGEELLHEHVFLEDAYLGLQPPRAEDASSLPS